MTTFLDGPAEGQTLLLKRAPIFLRVVKGGGKWDALDQPEDQPTPDEEIYAYRIEGEPGVCHVDVRGARGGFYTLAQYRLVPTQPEDRELRNTMSWRRWCLANQS
jgi:hypothetical protein